MPAAERKKKPLVPEDHVEKIEQYASAVNLSGVVVERAVEIYKEFAEHGGYIKRKNAPGLQVGAVYIAARQLGHMKMMKELEMKTDVSVPEIRRGDIKIRRGAPSAVVKDFQRAAMAETSSSEGEGEGEGKGEREGEGEVQVEREGEGKRRRPHDAFAKAAVDRVCIALNFTFPQRKCAEEMSYAVGKKGLGASVQPASMAGAIAWTCSLLFGRDDIGINDIVKHSVGRLTIRKAYKLLQPHFDSLIPIDIFGDPEDWQKKLKLP